MNKEPVALVKYINIIHFFIIKESVPVDVNECLRGTHKCKTGQICENHVGFYVCSCPSGHKMNSNLECEDIDECLMFKGRVCH